MVVGDAEVSIRHANFIVNRGQATAADVRTLIAQMAKAVADSADVRLEHEIVIWPEPISAVPTTE